jgi:hypothetical protein
MSMELPLPLGAAELRRTPAAIVEKIRALAQEQTDSQIAQTLNSRALRSGAGNAFTRIRVTTIRTKHGIPSLAQHLHDAGWLDTAEITARLGVHCQTTARFARVGLLRAVQVNDRGRRLFELPTGPLPRAHCGKRLRDRLRYPGSTPQKQEGMQYAA